MRARRVIRGPLWAGLACALLGCSGAAHTRSSHAALFGTRERAEAPERVFSILWWGPAEPSNSLPYRPIELASPGVDAADGTVFVATSDGLVHALAGGGRELWRWEGRGAIEAGPIFADGVVFVATTEGRLAALQAASGREIWTYDSGEELITSPVLDASSVYVRSSAGTLFAVDRQSGRWRWQYRREPSGQFTLHAASRPATSGEKVFAGFADGFAVALDARDGSVIWARQLGTGAQFLDVDAGPVLDISSGDPFAMEPSRNRVLFASYATGLFALDVDSGTIAWSAKRPGITALSLGPSGKRVYAGGVGFLGSWSLADGAPIWKTDIGGERAVSGLSQANGYLLAPTGEGPLLFVDERTGRVRRAFNPGRGVAAAPTEGPQGEATVFSNRGYVYKLAVEPISR